MNALIADSIAEIASSRVMPTLNLGRIEHRFMRMSVALSMFTGTAYRIATLLRIARLAMQPHGVVFPKVVALIAPTQTFGRSGLSGKARLANGSRRTVSRQSTLS